MYIDLAKNRFEVTDTVTNEIKKLKCLLQFYYTAIMPTVNQYDPKVKNTLSKLREQITLLCSI